MSESFWESELQPANKRSSSEGKLIAIAIAQHAAITPNREVVSMTFF